MQPLKKIYTHITRGWNEEPGHPRMRFLPPFFFDLLGYGLLLSIAYYLVTTLLTFLSS